MSEKCGYDLIDRSEEPEYCRDLRYKSDRKDGTTSKEQKVPVKANGKAMAYLALALKLLELLRLLTRAVTAEWPEGEAWK